MIDKIKHTIHSIKDLIEASMDRVIAAVGRELLERNALLLPDVYDCFCPFTNEQSHHLKDVDTLKLTTSSNILSNLVATLEHHITYCCKTRKYGTLLYRPQTDLTENLAKALCASFIIDQENPHTPGSLMHTTNITNDEWKHGLLSFLRLIGTVYLKKTFISFRRAVSGEIFHPVLQSIYLH